MEFRCIYLTYTHPITFCQFQHCLNEAFQEVRFLKVMCPYFVKQFINNTEKSGIIGLAVIPRHPDLVSAGE